MPVHGEHAATGAAKRRRERRLRQWQRHERMTVAMAVAEAAHHSAPRRQNTATAIREEVVHDAYDGLRAQKTPPPEVRPGSLVDPGPQRSDRSLRRSSVLTPLLAVPVLAGGDGVDGTALSFLVRRAVEDRKREKEEEEKEQARKMKEAQDKADLELAKRDPWWAQHLADKKAMEERRYKASFSSKRKRKKRRKRRTPRTSSLPGRARRRHRQWHVSLRHVVDVPVVRCVLFPQVLISSNDEICADNFIYFRFKLIGKGRSEQWEVFLYCDKTILLTVFARKCCPGVCLCLTSVVSASVRRPTLTRSTPFTSCVCHPSVAASRCRVVVDSALLMVLTILFGTW